MTQTFSIKIDLEGAPITNQKSSGRCWLFAATNCFRVAIMRQHNLKKFELSQAYLFYWDKLEKANWFLEQILDTVGEELDGRLVQRLLMDPVGDGGQWDMVANLVGKYGLVCLCLRPPPFPSLESHDPSHSQDPSPLHLPLSVPTLTLLFLNRSPNPSTPTPSTPPPPQQ